MCRCPDKLYHRATVKQRCTFSARPRNFQFCRGGCLHILFKQWWAYWHLENRHVILQKPRDSLTQIHAFPCDLGVKNLKVTESSCPYFRLFDISQSESQIVSVLSSPISVYNPLTSESKIWRDDNPQIFDLLTFSDIQFAKNMPLCKKMSVLSLTHIRGTTMCLILGYTDSETSNYYLRIL